mmetsp:Transcript_29742/g.54192  ORF Transcript_29742/g.54192 Transcript_29742/m.54192 type:complete len:263 (-) Transcript_29742:94-882(-)
MAKRNQKPVFGFKIGPMSCYTANVRSSQGGENHELQLEEAPTGGASSSTGGEHAHQPATTQQKGIVRLSGSSQKTKPFFGVKVGPMSCYCSTARGPPGPLGRHGQSGTQGQEATGLVEGTQSAEDAGQPPVAEDDRKEDQQSNSPGLPLTLKADKNRWEPVHKTGAASSPSRPEEAFRSPEKAEQHLRFSSEEAAFTAGSPAPSPVKDAPDAPRVLSDAIHELEETGEITKAAGLMASNLPRARKPRPLLARIFPWCCGGVQ